MRGTEQTQSPEEIERQIEATRQNLSQTLEALQQRLDPNDLLNEAVSYLKGNGADMGRKLVQSVRDNPVPVLLIGAGISWLALGGGRSGRRYREIDYRDYPGHVDDYGEEGPDFGGAVGYESGAYHGSPESREQEHAGIGQRAKEAWRSTKEKISSTGAKVKERTSTMVERISDRNPLGHHEQGEPVSGMHSQGEQGVLGEKARQVGERAGEAYHQLTEKSQGLYQRSRERASRMAHRVRERYGESGQSMRSMMEEHPLAMAAIGIGIGAFLGAVLPTSRREERMMGDARHDLREGLMETGREQFEKMRGAAERTAQSIREQAEQTRDQHLGERSDVGHVGYQTSTTTGRTSSGLSKGTTSGAVSAASQDKREAADLPRDRVVPPGSTAASGPHKPTTPSL